MDLDKSSIQRLVLMHLDDEIENLARENNKLFICLWVGVQDRFDVALRAYVTRRRGLMDMWRIRKPFMVAERERETHQQSQ